MPSKKTRSFSGPLTCDQIQPSNDKAPSSAFLRGDIRSILACTGEYSDSSSYDDERSRSRSSVAVSDDDKYVGPSPEHIGGDVDGDFLPAKDKHSNKRKKVPSQSDNNNKKSKVNSSEIASETTSTATTSKKDKISIENVSHIAYLRGKTKKLTGCNPFFISKEIEKSFSKVARVESRGFSLKLMCTSQKQKESVVNCTMLGNIEVVGSIPNVEARKHQNAERAKVHRVVITGVPVDVEDSVVKDETSAIEAKRIFKRYDASTVPTTAVILTFEVENIPTTVTVGYLRFKTKNYIPMVTRCYKCQKFGHTASRCRQESHTCPVCSGPHSYNECSVKENTETKKCANCGEAHSASYRGCEQYILAKQVTHRAAESRLSYRDALVQIKREKRVVRQTEGSAATISDPVASTSGELTRDSTLTAPSEPQKSQTATRSTRLVAQCHTPTTETMDQDLELNSKSTEGGNDQGSSTLLHINIFELLAVLCKLLDEPVISRSSIMQRLLSHAAEKLQQPIEEVRSNIDKVKGGDLNIHSNPVQNV